MNADNEKLRALVEKWRQDSLLLGESDGYGAQLDRCADELEDLLTTAPESAQVPEGMVLVRKEAIDWLNGESDFECPTERYFRGKPPRYWWRSVFREKAGLVAPEPPAAAEDDSTDYRCPDCSKLNYKPLRCMNCGYDPADPIFAKVTAVKAAAQEDAGPKYSWGAAGSVLADFSADPGYAAKPAAQDRDLPPLPMPDAYSSGEVALCNNGRWVRQEDFDWHVREYGKKCRSIAQPAGEVDEAKSPSYDALLLIAQSVCGALERSGLRDCDDPGEAIDVIRERLERRISELETASFDAEAVAWAYGKLRDFGCYSSESGAQWGDRLNLMLMQAPATNDQVKP